MSDDSGKTMVGKAPAGPQDERELLMRLAQACYKSTRFDVEDREVVYAITDVLDRANFVLESSVDVTVLAGAQGTYVNGRRYDIAKRPDLLEHVTTGFPARGLAGLKVTAPVDHAEMRAFLVAWKLPPEGTPKAARSRLREVWDGERMGRGLAGEAPLELVSLPADGRLPLPPGAEEQVAIGELELDDDDVLPPPEDDEPDGRPDLVALAGARLASVSTPPADEPPDAGQTAVRMAGDVIEEDRRASARAGESRSGDSKTGESKADWVSRSGPSSSWLSKDESSSWVGEEKAPDDEKTLSEEYKSAFQALASETQARIAEEVAGTTAVRRALDDDAHLADVTEAGTTAVRDAAFVIPEDLARQASGTGVQWVDEPVRAPGRASQPGRVDDLSPEATRATQVYARLVARIERALGVPPAEHDRAVAAVRRAVVEMLSGLAQTAFEDRLLALTAFPADGSRARHGANVAAFVAVAARACGLQRVALADLVVAAALHDEGDVESYAKADRWTQTLVRTLAGSATDTAIVRAVVSYERAGARGALPRPAPGSNRPRLESRLIACACAFDDACAGAPGREGLRPDDALARLGPLGHDPVATRALAGALGPYPRGLLVSLAPSEQLAVVLAGGGRRGERPRVRVFADARGQPIDVREIELSSSADLTVDRIEDPARFGTDPVTHVVAWG